MIRSIITTVVAMTATVGFAGDSAPFRLDTMEGTRVARETETIAYSTEWDNAGKVIVALDGVTLKEASAPTSGDVTWNTRNTSAGNHTLTHTTYKNGVVDKVESATFTVKAIYTITFNANGGSLGSDNPTRSITEGNAIGTLPTPTWLGYTFEGWWTEASGGTQISESTIVTGSVTYYAHWTVTQYTVTFNANGGTVGPTSVSRTYGQTIGTLPIPTRTGYTFAGWWTKTSGGTQISESTIVTGNVMYYARWTTNQYTVTFNPNGGRMSDTAYVTRYYGAVIGATPTPTRDNYTFDGWWTEASGGTQISFSTTVTGNVTYYAHWTGKQYTVTFDANGGTGGKTVTQNYGTALSAPTVTRTGYTFTGWSPSVPSTMPAGNVTYDARWTINQYTVTFDANGGTGGTSITQDYGTALSAPTVTREGYTFMGWSPSVPATVPASNVTYTAQWKSNAHEKVQLWEGGVYWATTNIGAENPEDSGYYFWWGDKTGHGPDYYFSQDNSAIYTKAKSVSELQSAGWVTSGGVLAPSHDAAYVQWGEDWRMPTEQEFSGLIRNCDWTWTTLNGVNGYVVKGKGAYASASIFLPAAGSGHSPSPNYVGSLGYYWSSVPYSGEAWILWFDSDNHLSVSYGFCWLGFPIRPVQGCVVTFDSNGGEGGTTRTVLPGDPLGVLPTPTREGYMFRGWFTAESGGTQIGESTVVMANVTYYAQWNANKYIVTFNANGGTGGKSVTQNYGTALSAPTVTRTGYTFTGWSPNVPSTMPAGNTTYTAQWTAYTHDKVQLWEGGPYWATTNIGAENPEDAGYYFWWGDTVGYRRENDAWVAIDGSSSNFSFSSSATPTYNKDVATLQSEGWITADGVLAPEHDAAHVHWGGDWRMPTDAEFSALINNCTTTWITTNGVSGRLVTGKGAYANRSIFLPAGGCGLSSGLFDSGSYGSYWSSTPKSGSSDGAWGFDFGSGNFFRGYDSRFGGHSVRPVRGDGVGNQYTVTFDANGGTGGKSVTQNYGAALSAPTVTRTGYTFTGWVPEVAATIPASNVTYTAQWRINQYTVTFNANGGEGGKSVTQNYGTALSAPTVTRTGYAFTGWSPSVPSTMPAANKTYTAQWTVCTHDKVQLWEDGPYWATTNIGADNPEDYGYYFWWGDTVGYKRENNKWVATDGSSSSFSFSSNAPTYNKTIDTLKIQGWITADSVLTPEHDAAHVHWGGAWRMPTDAEFFALINNCTTTWITTNGVTGRLVTGKGAYADRSIFLPAAGYGGSSSLKDPGSNGRYWSSTPNSANSYDAYDLYFDLSDFRRRSNYSRYYGRSVRPVQGYVVMFNANGGTGGTTRTILPGANVGALPTPTREGYMFTGWWTAASGGTQISATTVPDGKVTYYAHWTVNQYTVTFDANGGEGGTDITQNYGTALSAPTVTRTGYTFAGWLPEVAATVPASNVTYTAQWQINQYTVTFDANGGEGGTDITQNYGTALSAPTVTRTGYTFAGWSPSIPSTMPAANKTYTAQWRVNQYTVTFDANGGEGGASTTQNYDAVIVAPTVTREGYTFLGWATNATGEVVYAADQPLVNLTAEPDGAVTLYAVWQEVDLSAPVISPADGTMFYDDTCEVTITCATAGTTIYYSTNGRTPRFTEAYRYAGPFTITDTTTVIAVAVLGDSEEYAEATITKGEKPPLTLEGVLDASNLSSVTTSGDAEWIPVEDESAKVGGSCAQSGVVGMEEVSHLEVTVSGKGTLTFWWKVSCEPDPRGRHAYDNLSYSVDGTNVAWIDGERDWAQQSVTFDTDGAHTVRWTYSTDDWEEPGYSDCGWVDGVVWTPEGGVVVDPLPEIASDSEVTNALAGAGDEARLMAHIGNKEQYDLFRAWVDAKGLDHKMAKDSPRAWFSYAIGANGLVEGNFQSGDVEVASVEAPASEVFTFKVRVKNAPIGSDATAANLATVFEVQGSPSLAENSFSSKNVNAVLGVSADGQLIVSATPIGNFNAFFVRVRMYADEEMGDGDDVVIDPVGTTFSVTFDANGGEGGWSRQMDYGAAIVAPTVTRTGYAFTGWSPEVAATVPASNVTYTAQWQINQYTATFDANGGTGGKSVTQNYGTALSAPTVTRTGYTFTGWSPEVAATVPASNVTYKAQWMVQLWEGGPYWAETNIGAENPEDSGYYFWWGDTVGYRRENDAWVALDGSSSNLSFSDIPTYNKDIPTLQSEGWITADGVLAPEHDAAHVHWGGDWRMPTDAEFSALISNCTTTWTTRNGVYGRLVTGKGAYANRSIFLPAVGYGYRSYLADSGSSGYYWSSTPHPDDSSKAWLLYFSSSNFFRGYSYRLHGQSVRPVRGFAE